MDENNGITLEWGQEPGTETVEEEIVSEPAEAVEDTATEVVEDAVDEAAYENEFEPAAESVDPEAETPEKAEKPKSGLGKKMDVNGDGKFDFADIAAMMGKTGSVFKKGAQAVKDSNAEKTRQQDLKTLRPIFPETMDKADFVLPRFLCVVDRTKRFADSPACKGSIGYEADIAGMHLVNVFRDTEDAFKLEFYPDSSFKYYYRDPSDRNKYIALDFYFTYMKEVRIGELEKLAESLGAKHFKVTYKKEQTSFTARPEEDAEKIFSSSFVICEKDLPGHEPVKPALRYLEREEAVQKLIRARLEGAPAEETAEYDLSDEASVSDEFAAAETYQMNLANTLGLQENDAKAIEKFLKEVEQPGNASLVNEVKSEARRSLEFEIAF